MQSQSNTRLSRRSTARRRLAVTGLAGLVLVVAACGSSSTSPAASSSTKASASSSVAAGAVAAGTTGSAPSGSVSSGSTPSGSAPSGMAAMQADLAAHYKAITTYPAITPVSGAASKLKGKTIWYVPIGAQLPYLATVGAALTEALGDLGATVKTCDGKFQPTEVASCLTQAAAQGADAVVTGYIAYQLVPNAFDALIAKGIPVLIGGEAPGGGKTNSAKLAFYDDTPTQGVTQRLLAEHVITASNGKAKVLYLGITDSPQLIAAEAVAKKYFSDNCAACTFTAVDYGTTSMSKLSSQIGAALASHPDTTDLVLELDGQAGPIAAAGLQNAGKSSTITLSSGGVGLDSMQRVKAGAQAVLVSFTGVYGGWQFADAIVRLMTGNPAAVTIGAARVFVKDNVQDLTLTPAASSSISWYGDSSYKATFLKAWGAKTP